MVAFFTAWALMGGLLAPLAGQDGSISLQQYLHLRRAYGIHTAVAEPALDSFVGTETIEIAGIVNGVMKVAGQTSVLVQKPDGQVQALSADQVPDWMEGGDVNARLIVRAYRASAESPLSVRLLAASPENPIAEIEAKDAAAEALKAARLARKSSTKSFSGSTGKPASHPRRVWNLPVSDAVGYYAAFIHNENRHLTNNQAYSIAQGVLGFSIHFGVDARLIMAILMVESGFDPFSTSHSGAQGLGQLMPDTAREMGITDAYDTNYNLFGTVKLVRHNLETYNAQTGDPFRTLVLALAAYNAGEGAVKRHGGVPPYRETQAYVKRVIQLYRRFSGF